MRIFQNKSEKQWKKKYILEKLSPKNVYFILSISGIIMFFIAAFFLKSKAFDWLAMENNSDYAMSDYFEHVFYALDRSSVYDHGNRACFPPLAYLFYYFIGRITSNGEEITSKYKLIRMPYSMMIFIIYCVIGIVILIYAIEGLKINNRQKKFLAFSLIFSTPLFAGALERGNSILYVVGLLLIAMNWRESESKLKREGALILIAISAGLKIYPAFFGILYLKEKRYKEAVRLIIYGILFFFVPFIFFGGIKGIIAFYGVVSQLMGADSSERVQFFTGILDFTGINWLVAYILNIIFLIFLIILTMVTENDIRKMTFLAATMAFFPNMAYRYTLLYFLFPLFILFDREKKPDVDTYINAVFLGLLFSIPTVFGICTGFRLSYSDVQYSTYTCVERYIYTVAWLYLLYQVIAEIVCRIKMRAVRQL